MAYIIAQKVVRDGDGKIVSGSASIQESVYIKDDEKKYHSKHIVREKLGKVLWLSDDKKVGIFMSPTRGLVEYDSNRDEFNDVDGSDSRLEGHHVFPKAEVHTVIGDVYLLLQFLHMSGMNEVLRKTFTRRQDLERVVCHILHGVLKDGSRISCGDFIVKSAASSILSSVPPASLDSDTAFFTMMGDDAVKHQFFKIFVSEMRKRDKDFGKCSYVDSTPLPNDIADNPMNSLCSHGLGSVAVQTRLVFILDKKSGLPVWFHIIPGNVLDVNTIRTVIGDIADTLGIIIDDLVLDAGYVSKDLFTAENEGLFKTIIARMPAKKGYPYKKLYESIKGKIGRGRNSFVRNGHVYFGDRKEIDLFGHKINAYIYTDWMNADSRRVEWESKHQDDIKTMKPSQKDWLGVEFGYFVLLSEKNMTPEQLLDEYFERTEIETMNKTAKDYAELLPLRKWSSETILGKILYDIIDTIIIVKLRKQIRENTPDKKQARSLSYIIGKTQSLMCRENKGNLIVECPNKQTKEAYKLLKVAIPSTIKISTLRDEILGRSL